MFWAGKNGKNIVERELKKQRYEKQDEIEMRITSV